jgi:uncharacterized protein (TIGR02246 family)
MHKLLVAVALLASLCSPAVAGPKEEALQVVQNWTKAFTESDVDGIVKLYAPDALFFGTGSKTLVTKTEDIRKYFEAALLTNRPRSATVGDHSAVVLSDNAVAVTGLDTVTQTKDGKILSANGRTTFVVARRDAGWQIVHFHRSAMPN